MTQSAAHFAADVQTLGCKVWTDADEWAAWQQRGDPVTHINVTPPPQQSPPQLKNAASALVIAPLSANTLSKLANGLADNLVVPPPPASQPNRSDLRCARVGF
jgi:phosphopantothenoylcysteine decarboxylase